MLTKRDQETIDLHPVLLRQDDFKCSHRVCWSASLDVSATVGDAVDMDVDPNTWLMTPNPQNQVSAFGTNPSERAQQSTVPRQCPAVCSRKIASKGMYLE